VERFQVPLRNLILESFSDTVEEGQEDTDHIHEHQDGITGAFNEVIDGTGFTVFLFSIMLADVVENTAGTNEVGEGHDGKGHHMAIFYVGIGKETTSGSLIADIETSADEAAEQNENTVVKGFIGFGTVGEGSHLSQV